MKRFLVLLFMAGAALFTLSGCGSKAEIEMTDYMNVEFAGIDGEGRAEAYFDKAAMEVDVFQELAGDDEEIFSQELLEELGNFAGFENSITCSLDKSEGLSSGDQVTVTVSYDKDSAKECGIKVAGDMEKTFEVEGLKERVEIDPFDSRYFNTEDGIEISFSGRDPFGTVSIENHMPESDPLSKVRYRADKEENLQNGDKITISASLISEMEEEGYVLKEETAVITAHDMDYYVTDKLEPGMWELIQPYCDQEITDELDNVFYIKDGEDSYRFTKHDVLSFEGITYGEEAFLATSKIKEQQESYNLLIVPYSIHATLPGDIRLGENETAAGYMIIRDVIRTADGGIDTEEMAARMPEYSYTSLEQADSESLGEIRVNYELVTVALQ